MAARHWVGGNATWDNTAGSKWSLTSGGAGGQAVPTSADDVFLDNGTGTGNVTTAANTTQCTCKTLNCTGYVGTLTVNGTITVAGNVTLVNAMTITTSAGTPILAINATSTITTDTKTWPYAITLSGTSTITLAEDITLSGLLTIPNTLAVITFSGAHNITCGSASFGGTGAITLSGNITITGSTTFTAGTTTINGAFNLNLGGNVTVNNLVTATGTASTIFNGTGTLTTTGSGVFGFNTEINTAGTITFSGSCAMYTSGNSGKNFVYTTGTIAGTSTPNIIFAISSVVTLNSLFTFAGTITVIGATGSAAPNTTTFNGTSGFTISDFTCTAAVSQKTLVFQASNTYTMTHGCILTGTAANPIILNSSSGGTRFSFILNNGAPSLDIGYVTATDPDSSSGRTMWNYKGTDNNTVNWAILGNPQVIPETFIQ